MDETNDGKQVVRKNEIKGLRDNLLSARACAPIVLGFLLFQLIPVAFTDWWVFRFFSQSSVPQDCINFQFWYAYIALPAFSLLTALAYYSGGDRTASLKLLVTGLVLNFSLASYLGFFYIVWRRPLPQKWSWLWLQRLIIGQDPSLGAVILWILSFLLLVFAIWALPPRTHSKDNKTKNTAPLVLAGMILVHVFPVAIGDWWVWWATDHAIGGAGFFFQIWWFFGLVSAAHLLIAVSYYLGGGGKTTAIKLLLSGFLINFSALEDLSFFVVAARVPLPKEWFWAIPPTALLGSPLSTPEVLVWCVIWMLVIAAVWVIPWEAPPCSKGRFIRSFFKKRNVFATLDLSVSVTVIITVLLLCLSAYNSIYTIISLQKGEVIQTHAGEEGDIYILRVPTTPPGMVSIPPLRPIPPPKALINITALSHMSLDHLQPVPPALASMKANARFIKAAVEKGKNATLVVNLELETWREGFFYVRGANVTAHLGGQMISCVDQENGTYLATIDTSALKAGINPVMVVAKKHRYVSTMTYLFLTVTPYLRVQLLLSENSVVRGANVVLTVTLTDSEGKSVEGAIVKAEILGEPTPAGIGVLKPYPNGLYNTTIQTILIEPAAHVIQITAEKEGYPIVEAQLPLVVRPPTLHLQAELSSIEVWRGEENVTLQFNVTDDFGKPADDVDIAAKINNQTITFDSRGPGVYNATIYTRDFEPANYTITISAARQGYLPASTSLKLTILRPLLYLDAQVSSTEVTRGENVTLQFNVSDVLGRIVDDANITVLMGGLRLPFERVEVGSYNATISTADFEPANYTITISATKPNYTSAFASFKLRILRPALSLRVLLSSSRVVRGENVTLRFDLADNFGKPVADANVTAKIDNQTLILERVDDESYSATIVTANLEPSTYNITISSEKEGYISTSRSVGLTISGYPWIVVGGWLSEDLVNVGENATLYFTVTDNRGHALFDSNITIQIDGEMLAYTDLGNGSHSSIIETGDRDPSVYVINVVVKKEGYLPGQFSIKLTVSQASLRLRAWLSSSDVMKGENITLYVIVSDNKGGRVNDSNVTILIGDQPLAFSDLGEGSYKATVVTADLEPGTYNITISAEKEGYISASAFIESTILPRTFRLEAQLSSPEVEWGENVTLNFNMTDILGRVVEDADITIKMDDSLLFFQSLGSGSYEATIASENFAPANYTVILNVTKTEYISASASLNLTILPKPLHLQALLSSSEAVRGETVILEFNVTDALGGAVDANITVLLDNLTLMFESLGGVSYNLTLVTTDLEPTTHLLAINVEKENYTSASATLELSLINPWFVVSVSTPEYVVVGEDANVSVFIIDNYGYNVSDAAVTVSVNNVNYTGRQLGNGLYTTDIDTVPLRNGIYDLTVWASKLGYSMATERLSLLVKQPLIIDVSQFEGSVTVGEVVLVGMNVSSLGEPVEGATLTISPDETSFFLATEQGGGAYLGVVGTADLEVGAYNLTVTAAKEGYEPTSAVLSLRVGMEGMVILWLDPTTRGQMSAIADLLLYIAIFSAALLLVKGMVSSVRGFKDKLERYRREIGLMEALGATDRDVVILFSHLNLIELLLGLSTGLAIATFVILPRINAFLSQLTVIYEPRHDILVLLIVGTLYSIVKVCGTLAGYLKLKRSNLINLMKPS